MSLSESVVTVINQVGLKWYHIFILNYSPNPVLSVVVYVLASNEAVSMF